MKEKAEIVEVPLFKNIPLSKEDLEKKNQESKLDIIKFQNYLKKSVLLGIFLSSIVFATMLYNVSDSFAYLLFTFVVAYLVGSPFMLFIMVKYCNQGEKFSNIRDWQESSIEQTKLCEALLARKEMSHWTTYMKKLEKCNRSLRNYEVREIKKDWEQSSIAN